MAKHLSREHFRASPITCITPFCSKMFGRVIAVPLTNILPVCAFVLMLTGEVPFVWSVAFFMLLVYKTESTIKDSMLWEFFIVDHVQSTNIVTPAASLVDLSKPARSIADLKVSRLLATSA